MTDPNATLYFNDPTAYTWKVDQLARTDGSRDEEDLLRYAATEPGGMFHVSFQVARAAVATRRRDLLATRRPDAA